jgi:hypothetical protein
MQVIKKMLLKSIAVIAFMCLTLGSSTLTCSANARTGSGGPQDQGATDTINGTSGSGTGGSIDTDTSPNYHGDQPGVDQEGISPAPDHEGVSNDNSTGSSPGGSTDSDADTAPSRLQGTGPHYGTAPLGGPSGNGMGDTNLNR